MREKYLSLNGDEQDTFLFSDMQLIKDPTTGTHVEYFFDLSLKCCQAAFKIAIALGTCGSKDSRMYSKGIMDTFQY